MSRMTFRIREIYYASRFLFNRSQPAFAGLYRLHAPALFRVAMQLTAGDRSISEAILVKVWAKAIAEPLSVSSIPQYGTGLTSLLVTCSREHYHSQEHYMLIHDPLYERIISRVKEMNIISADIKTELALELLPVG